MLIGKGAVRAPGRKRGRHDAYKRCSRSYCGPHSYNPTLQTTSQPTRHRRPTPPTGDNVVSTLCSFGMTFRTEFSQFLQIRRRSN
jgi:hypothetical protein